MSSLFFFFFFFFYFRCDEEERTHTFFLVVVSSQKEDDERRETNTMEDAFARSIGEVESHFDGVFFFSFSRAFGVGGLGVKRSTESAKREEEEEG